MGDYDEAAAAYNTVQALGRAISSPLALAYMSDSRMAYLSYLRGNSAEAVSYTHLDVYKRQELLHAAMQIDAHRAVRHPSASRNFRTGHALDEPQN